MGKKENLIYIQNEIDNFLKHNWDGEVRNSIVWDAFKAFLRGILIAISSKNKKGRDKKMKELQEKIKGKERDTQKPGNRKKDLTELKILQEQMHLFVE